MGEDSRRVVVVGSGPTGAMAATVLIRQGIPVTLLESGQALPSGWLVRAGGRTLYRRLPEFGPPQEYVSTLSPKPSGSTGLSPVECLIFGAGRSPGLHRRTSTKGRDCTNATAGRYPMKIWCPTMSRWKRSYK